MIRRIIIGFVAAALTLGVALIGATSANAGAQSYGNVRNGGSATIWTDQVAIYGGGTSYGSGDLDANYLKVPAGYSMSLWQIATRGDGSKYWAWKGCYSIAGYIPLGNTSYYAGLSVGWGC